MAVSGWLWYGGGGAMAGRREAESRRRVIGYYEDAVGSDPDSALAWSGLAGAHFPVRFYDLSARRPTGYQAAADAADQALNLSPVEPEVQAAFGYVADWADRDSPRASTHLDPAVSPDGTKLAFHPAQKR